MAGVHTLPRWVVFWSVFSALICILDAGFIVMRPHSLPGGKYHTLWKPYALYITIDTLYADMNSTYVYGMSLMNFVEVFLNFVSLYMNSQGSKYTVGVTFTVAVMTFWKSVQYLLTCLPLCGAGECSLHADLVSSLAIMIIPCTVWIIVPFLIMMNLWNRLFHGDLSQKLK